MGNGNAREMASTMMVTARLMSATTAMVLRLGSASVMPGVPAAMLEDRPLRSVTVNGVTFHTGDIEALVIAAYNRSGADMIGGRCNDKEVERDEQGRPTDSRCRDSNPGTLHIIMTNYLGLNQIAFAEDRTYNYEVWNQPVVSYDITKMDEVTVQEANDPVKGPWGHLHF